MKKLVFLLSVLVFVVPASASVIFSDDFSWGSNGPDSIGSDETGQYRLPFYWDRYAATPGSTYMFLVLNGQGGGEDRTMELSQWGSNCGIQTWNAYDVNSGSKLNISVETKSDGWGWHLTGLVKGIFTYIDGEFNDDYVNTVSVPLTDIAHGVYITETEWTTRNVTMAVPAGAVKAKFVLESYRNNGENGAIYVDNFTVTEICTAQLSADLNGDCKVDINDFAEFASQWLTCTKAVQSECW